MTIADIENRLEKIKAKHNRVSNKHLKYENMSYWKRPNWAKFVNADLEQLSLFIEKETKYIEELRREKQDEFLEREEYIAKKYSDRRAYFIDTKASFQRFVDVENMTYLMPMISAIDELLAFLDEYSICYEFLPVNLNVLINELNNEVLPKIIRLEESKKDEYVARTNTLVLAFSQKIKEWIEQQKKADINSLDASITTMMQELNVNTPSDSEDLI
jgi:hypothetical protein